MTHLGKLLCSTRKQKQMKQGEAAQCVGVSQALICFMEAGREVGSIKTIRTYGHVLGLTDLELKDAYIQDVIERTSDAWDEAQTGSLED